MLNITAVGHLGKDPELRTTQSGQEITSFSLGVSVFANGEKQTEWIRCSLWGKRGETFRNYCQKGSQVTVSGKGFHNTWTGKEGEVTDFCIDVQDFSLPAREQKQEPVQTGACPMPAATTAEEIPF